MLLLSMLLLDTIYVNNQNPHYLLYLGEHKSLQSLPQLGNALCAEKLEANSKVS
jgi:hypothetical protein